METADRIRTLPELIRKNGFTYKLITRTREKAIYAQYCENVLISYEVFQIRVRGAQFSPLLMKQIEAIERFPGNEDFGKTAWTYRNLEKAVIKFNELLKGADNEIINKK